MQLTQVLCGAVCCSCAALWTASRTRSLQGCSRQLGSIEGIAALLGQTASVGCAAVQQRHQGSGLLPAVKPPVLPALLLSSGKPEHLHSAVCLAEVLCAGRAWQQCPRCLGANCD